MIQRIQTVFLLLSMIATVVMFFTPVITIEGLDVLITTGVFQVLGIMIAIILVISFATILLFKKRLLQVRLCIYNMILLVAFYGLLLYLLSSEIPENTNYSFKIAAIMPIVS
jgi:hypothetical protein